VHKVTPTISLLWSAVGLAVLYWPFEALMDTLLSGQGHFYQHLLPTDSNELWMRSVISMLLIAIGVYAHRLLGRQQRLLERTDRLNRLLKFLSEVNQHVQRHESHQRMFENICSAAVDIAGFHFAWVGSDEIKPLAQSARNQATLQAIRQLSTEGTAMPCTIAARAMADGRPCYCNNMLHVDCPATWRESLLRQGCRSAAAFPITIQDQPYAVLTVYTGNSAFFHEQEIALLKEAADDISYALTHLENTKQHRQSLAMLQHIEQGTATVTGTVFFRSLTRHVASALEVALVFVAEHRGEKARSLAIYKDGDFVDDFEWALAGTPCAQVAAGEEVVVRSGVQERYPEDQLLKDEGIQSYIGIPMTDPSGRIIGHLGVLDTSSLVNPELLLTVLKTFVVRAGVELQRLRDENVLRQRLEELERFRKATSRREFRIKELREENASLRQLNPRQQEEHDQ